MSLVGIINYGIGNLTSVQSALQQIKAESFLIEDLEGFDRATHIILPGVGAFATGMENLHQRGFVCALHERVVAKQKPLLGICLGMQLLGSVGYEFGETPGLGIIPGKVIKLDVGSLRLPHVGWNDLRVTSANSVITQDFEGQAVYFVHSFHLATDDPADTCATSNYGKSFAACVARGKTFGAQFHPEKSQTFGLKLLQNFVSL